MGTATALAPGLSRKLKKVLETRTDTPDLLASLQTVSNFYSENTPQTRRYLRFRIEKRGLSINKEFLAASAAAPQMCEQAAEAHKSKGVIHSSRRNRVTSDPSQLCRSSIDSILDNSSSAPSSQAPDAPISLDFILCSMQIREIPAKIFLINCLYSIGQPLLGHEVAS